MNITAKSRYALKIMMDLAVLQEEGHQQRQSIAQRQNIPLDFMDQITSRLRAADLVRSIRGRSGGFELCKAPAEISLWAIFQAVEDSLYPVKCLEDEFCGAELNCMSIGVWEEVFSIVRKTMSGKTLADSVEKWKARNSKQIVTHEVSSTGTCGRPRSDTGAVRS